jgi:hypothetical protein
MSARWTYCLLAVIASLALAACAPIPTVPHVMAYPGRGKSLYDFDADDATCRSWASSRIEASPGQAATDSTLSGAAIGTLLGGAAGAALGAAAGNPAMGAAAGAGVGLLGGTSYGVANGQAAAWSLQQRFDVAYAQCMYASGNQVPGRRRPPPPPGYGPRVPPPPYGAPPPPPPGVS